MNQKPQLYRSGKIRFFALFLIAMAMFGNQYAFNNPQALQQSLQHHLGINQPQFQMFYTIFAFPNIFATFIIGFLIDFLGVRIGIVALSGGVALFQLVVAIGGYVNSYQTMLIGRMLFGIASESLVTAQASMVSFWFSGKQLAFALGIAITFPELGNALNSLCTPLIYDAAGQQLGPPLLVSVGICLVSCGTAIWAAIIDKKADQVDQANNLKIVDSNTQANQVQSQEIKCTDLKKLKGTFWLLVFLCMFAVGLYVPFLDSANRMFSKRFCFTQASAGKAIMITYLVAAIFSAPLGILVDKIGFKRYFIMATMGIFTLAHFILLVYPQCGVDQQTGVIWALFLLGIGYCFYANCILPAIPLVVKRKVTGTAFGIMQMIQSIALAFFPIISGFLVENAGDDAGLGYRHSSLFFLTMGLLGIFASCGLLLVSDRAKRKLDKKSKDMQIHIQMAHKQGHAITDSQTPSSAQQQVSSSNNLQQKLLPSQKKQVKQNL